MRLRPAFLTAALAVGMTACSGAPLQTGGSELPTTRGIAPQPIITPQPFVSWQQSLFVNDQHLNTPSVRLFNDSTWAPNGLFSAGVGQQPQGNWSDQKYLYVANYGLGNGANVREYRPNNPTPIFTYSNGFSSSGEAGNVSTQVLGNVHYVYVTGDGDGFVTQFRRDTNTVIATCYTPPFTDAKGVAVDQSGNVFVSYYGSVTTAIVEYAGGLSGCNATQLPIAFGPKAELSGMVLDNVGRLVVCDEAGAVDVIDPPYTSISGTLGSGWFSPRFVSIRADNTRIYVSDSIGHVQVLQYPSGTVLHTIGSADGLHQPQGVVDWQNFGF